MMINSIENRQAMLFNKSSNFSKEILISSTKDYKLSLRKRRIEEHLLLKRNISITNENEYKSTLNQVAIPKEVKESLINLDTNNIPQLIEKCSLIAQRISQYLNNVSILTFLLDQLNNVLAFIPIDSLHLVISTKIINSLHSIISKYKTNQTLIYLVLAPMIKCSTSTDKDFIDKFISVPFLQNYIDLLVYVNRLQFSTLAPHFILFLSNIVSENDYIQEVFYLYKIFDLIADNLSDESNDNDIKASIVFFACFASLKRFPDLDCVLKLHNLFFYFHYKAYLAILNGVNVKYNEELVNTCLWGIFFIYFHQDSELLSEDNFDISLIEELIESCEFRNKGYHLVLGILGNITSRNDGTICDRVLNDRIAMFILKCLNDNDIQNKLKAMWVVSNLSMGTQLRCLVQYNFYNAILTLMKEENNHKVHFEFLELMINCFSVYENESIVEYETLLTKDLFTIIYRIKESEYCNQLLLILIDLLCKTNLEAAFICLKNIGIKDFLERCSHMENKEIQMQSNELLETYFKEIA